MSGPFSAGFERYVRSSRNVGALRDMDFMIIGLGFEEVFQDLHLPFECDDDGACVPQVIVGDALEGVGSGCYLVEVGSDSADFLGDGLEPEVE